MQQKGDMGFQDPSAEGGFKTAHEEAPQAASANLVDLLKEMVAEVLNGDREEEDQRSFVQRARDAVIQRAPGFRMAARSASEDIMHWMHRGGPWRAFLVTAVGTVIFVSLAALAIFILFFVTATANAVAVGFLMSVSGVGAFVAIFFTTLTAIYIGALLAASFAISTIALFTVGTVILVAGSIVFGWVLWQLAKKGIDLIHGSLAMTASALSAVGSTQTISIQKTANA